MLVASTTADKARLTHPESEKGFSKSFIWCKSPTLADVTFVGILMESGG